MAWKATCRLFPDASSEMRYTNVAEGEPVVAIRVEIRTWMGPRLESKWSAEPSSAAAAEVGYSPPTPTPAMPRAIARYQSMLEEGWTWKARVERSEPRITRSVVRRMPV